MRQVHVYISGFVQGVGYRYFIKSNAKRLGLTGWVCNMPDGRVEAVFQFSKGSDPEGKEKKMEKMIEICKKGPMLSQVKDITVSMEDAKEVYNSFEVFH